MKKKFLNKLILTSSLILSLVFSVSSYGDEKTSSQNVTVNLTDTEDSKNLISALTDKLANLFIQTREESLSRLQQDYSVSGTQYSLDWEPGSKEHIAFLEQNIENKEKLLKLIEVPGYESSDAVLILLLTVANLGMVAAEAHASFDESKRPNYDRNESRVFTNLIKDTGDVLKDDQIKNKSSAIFNIAKKDRGSYFTILMIGLSIYLISEANDQDKEFHDAINFSKQQYEKYLTLNKGNEKALATLNEKFNSGESFGEIFRSRDIWTVFYHALKTSLKQDKKQLAELKEVDALTEDL